jgi:hypothetical protein
MTTHDSLITWSRLSTVPAVAYHPHSHSTIVYWCGVGMVRASALLVTGSQWGMLWPSPKMKHMAYHEFLRAYRLGAFGSADWHKYIDNLSDADYHSYLVKWMTRENKDQMTDLAKSYTIQEALSWFSAANTQVIDG